MNLPYWINQSWYWLSRGEAMRFERAIHSVRSVQSEKLLDTLQRNRKSEYGRRFRFDRIRSVDDFRENVPVVQYDALSDYVERIARGERDVLTSEPVERLVPTGGSSGGAKRIPYTAALKQDFQKAIAAWIEATFRFFPGAMNGRAYWSITPMASATRRTTASIPIGFESDSEYLGTWSRWFAERLMLPPSHVAKLRNVENARYANLLYWIASSDVTLISVWSPTFLLSLLNQLDPWIESICSDIAKGSVRLPNDEASDTAWKLPLRADPIRSQQLKTFYREMGNSPDFLRACWPRLSLVSCWGDGNSRSSFAKLQRLFSHAAMQPKGLLATECVVSFPATASGQSVLAVRSHFFEFSAISGDGETNNGQMFLADELSLGHRYRVVVTTSGGLYRYDLGDVVEVVGFDGGCPLLRFIGRMDAVIDLVGEKLNEEHVRGTLETLFRDLKMDPEFFLLVVRDSPQLGYTLVLTADSYLNDESCDHLAHCLDERLRSNPQYDVARNLNQLARVDVRILPVGGRVLWSRFEEWQSESGRRVGELKANVLDYRGNWRDFLSQTETR
jgi:hypothetical protein